VETWLGPELIEADCLRLLAAMPDGLVQATVTSPPYDAVQTFEGNYRFDGSALARELFRVTSDGGWCVIQMQDQAVKGARTGSSFRTAVAFLDAGWRMFETCVFYRNGRPQGNSNRWRLDHQYIFQFYKGRHFKTLNREPLMVPTASKKRSSLVFKRPDGAKKDQTKTDYVQAPMKDRGMLAPG
jgi:hypothetical protein